jgi:formamidopyrimidine-DNA glycosylase
MPKLPEVEVTRLSFASRISGARILAMHMGKPLRWPLGIAPSTFGGANGVAGQTARQIPFARRESAVCC